MKRIFIYFLPVLFLSLTSCKYVNKWFGKSAESQEQVATLILQKQELENRIKTDSANYAREIDALRLEYEAKLAEFEKTNKRPATGFFVVVGSFKNGQLAEKYSAKIKSMGYDGNMIEGPGDFICITSSVFGSLREALPALNDARSSITPNAWIFFK